MILTVSNMRGGACSEDTGEDGKEDRQLHMQKKKKRHFLERNIHKECVVWDIIIQRNCGGLSYTHNPSQPLHVSVICHDEA